MTTMTAKNHTDGHAGEGRSLLRWTILLLVLEPVLMYAAFFVLSSSINWPASLDEPASVNLPLVTQERGAVILGYGVYLAYSLLILPLSVMLYFTLKGRGPRRCSPSLRRSASSAPWRGPWGSGAGSS